MDTTVQVAPADPGRRKSSKWLDVPRLKAEIQQLTMRQCADKRALQRMQQEQSRDGHDPNGYLAHEAVDYNANQLTLLCAIRALHRGRKHVYRQRVFGPGYPNGTAVVTRPIRIPRVLLDRYRVST